MMIFVTFNPTYSQIYCIARIRKMIRRFVGKDPKFRNWGWNSGGVFLLEVEPHELAEKMWMENPDHVHTILPIDRMVREEYDDIKKAMLELACDKIGQNETFGVKVRKRRTNLHSSIITREFGRAIQERFHHSVDLKNPDKLVLVTLLSPVAMISVLNKREQKLYRRESRLKMRQP
ncbi:MAG: THUMP domain-containing protein [Methanocellales archaeon]|nr:THUMP domain-containing protein [Methanocellales archaeon]